MAQVIFERRCAERGLDAHASSTGLTFVGRAAEPDAIEAMRDGGMDLAAHASRILDEATISAADLVIGMERKHVIESVVLLPETFRRTFTLKELARAVTNFGIDDGETLEGWLDRVGSHRRPSDLMGGDASDDVADPFRKPLSAYRATARELEELVERVVHLVAQVAPSPAVTGSSVTAPSERG
ncbi:MAG: hypothetical protein JWN46_2408 [Acidimicrobiales bacterium]|nr:hypothetical protein [Acidimicrobiales bacterium]